MPKKKQQIEDTKILEDWLTFPFTNVRVGHGGYSNERIFDIYEWKPRMYCMSCGALWSMEVNNPPLKRWA